MTSTITAIVFSANTKQFAGAGFPVWGLQVKLVLEIKGLWADIQEPKQPAEMLAAEDQASKAVATGKSVTVAPLAPHHDRLMKQKIAASIIMSVLSDKLAAVMYLLDNRLAMLRHLRFTYNAKCSASAGAEHQGDKTSKNFM